MSIPWSQRSRHVLVDTSAYYSSVNRKSERHEQVHEVFARLASHRQHLFTTNLVVAETHALLLSRLGRGIAAEALRWIDASSATIVRVSAADERRAKEIIFTHTDKDYSLTDATSFAVMERLRIGTAFTYDLHFAQFGFAVLCLDEG